MIDVVAGLAIEADRVLLVQHWPSAESAWSEKWCFPGGKADLHREWREVMSGEIVVGDLLHVAVRRSRQLVEPYRVWHYHVMLLSAPEITRAGGPRMRWWPVDDVASLDVIAGTLEALAAARAMGLVHA